MIVALRKTSERTARFLGRALACRVSDRQHAAVALGLVAGKAWLAVGFPGDSDWAEVALVGTYLLWRPGRDLRDGRTLRHHS